MLHEDSGDIDLDDLIAVFVLLLPALGSISGLFFGAAIFVRVKGTC